MKAAQDQINARLAWVSPKYRKGYLDALGGKCSPREAIKAMCLQCIGYDPKDVTLCTARACPLYAYRPFQRPEAGGCDAQDGLEGVGASGDAAEMK